MTLLQLVILGVLVEAIWETLKMTWQEGKFSWDKLGALVVGILIALLVNADLFALLEFEEFIPYIAIRSSLVLLKKTRAFLPFSLLRYLT